MTTTSTTTRAFVIGDFHLGEGDEELEDFKQDHEFASFLERIGAEGTTLFINGDFVDFAQIAPFTTHADDRLLWDEQTSIIKLEKAFKAHEVAFDALRAYLAAGGALVFLTGNHDLDMTFEGVRRAFADRLQPPKDEQLAFEDGFHVYHGVHIQHGFHFCPENSPKDPTVLKHKDQAGVEQLERVWGTDFLLRFYNDLERKYRFADNVKPHYLVLFHGLKNGWLPKRDAAKELWRFATFMRRRGIPWKGLSSAVLAGDPAAKTLTKPQAMSLMRGSFGKDPGEAAQLLMELSPGDKEHLYKAAKALDPEDLSVLLHGEAASLGESEANIEATPPAPAEGADPDDEGEGALLGVIRDRRDIRAARELLSRKVTAVVFGHTHQVVDGAEEATKGYWNPGTWLPRLDLRAPDVRAMLEDEGVTEEVLSDDTLYTTEHWVVRILPQTSHRAKVDLVLAEDA